MPRFAERAVSLFYRLAVSGLLPVALFRDVDPGKVSKAKRKGRLTLEIVSHCWRYGHFLTYQLSSLVNHRTDKLGITMTVFHVADDEAVTRVLDYFGRMEIPGITWNWQALPKEKLFRRSIGRNLAAKNTQADWIWFTDADIIFHERCLDTLADLLQGRDDSLVHPRIGLGTELLPDDHEILEKGRQGPAVLEIPLEMFKPYGGPRKKAKGPHQITHGDIARACGYCDAIAYYQQPAERWMKTYEDRAFRWLIGTHGTPLDIPNVCQIRHIVKGRYQKDSWLTRVRKFIRKSQDR
ncbi:MAG: glycosyltransferase family A protein [Woeseiaceae bacterium]|nr:glycosyltransferase family A protein [Woeseiaceae bacterium]